MTTPHPHPHQDDPLLVTIASLVSAGHVTLHNARGEFACNSSSSHSIVVLGDTVPAEVDAEEPGYYGWDHFVLTSSSAKIRYLAAMVKRAQPDLAASLQASIEHSDEDYVDHQSVLTAPVDRFGDSTAEFFADLATLLARPEVAVLGGNDNGDDASLPSGARALELPTYGSWRARRDELDGHAWWVLFNTGDGTKLRISLDPSVEPTKAPTPELVDVKLTDRCPFELDCGFCYMGSTRGGAEADPTQVMALLTSLADLGVFEIAFGGGEPTLWPHFSDLLAFSRSLGLVPNFTTKNYQFITRTPEMLDLAGSVAFSVNDSKSLTRLTKSLPAQLSWDQRDKICLQVIPEICDDAFLEEVIDFASSNHFRLTFLGYKTTGRGGAYDGRLPRPAGFWIPLVTPYPHLRLALDTTLADTSRDALEASDVPSWCYHTTEGSFSMYVDAVTGRASASSYVEPEVMDEIDLSAPPSTTTTVLGDLFKGY